MNRRQLIMAALTAPLLRLCGVKKTIGIDLAAGKDSCVLCVQHDPYEHFPDHTGLHEPYEKIYVHGYPFTGVRYKGVWRLFLRSYTIGWQTPNPVHYRVLGCTQEQLEAAYGNPVRVKRN